MQSVLCDSLFILYFGLFAGWSFSIINFIVFILGQPLLLIPTIFIRPPEYKIGKTRGVILVLIVFVMAISGFVAYCLGVESVDSSLWPIWFKLMLGCCFVAAAAVMLSKLLQDMKVI
jgi:hypothetical protein